MVLTVGGLLTYTAPIFKGRGEHSEGWKQ